jgi:N-acetylmuramoyl-L-alanine amidase
MRSSGRWTPARGFRGLAAGIALLMALATPGVRAQSTQAAALYAEAMTREAALRKELDSHSSNSPSDPLLRRIRVLVGSYRDMARLFPASGYSDNALWQAGMLAADAYWHFGEPVDRATALSLLKSLPARFPTSSRVKQVGPQVARLEESAPRRAPAAVPTPSVRPVVTASAPVSATPAALTGIRREVLAEVLRVTLELEREVPFYDERLEAPSRVFIDLQNARATDALKDATIPYPDDVVKQIRVGRQIDARTRVVLDLTSARPYSVYALYNPYRIVIDFERSTTTAVPFVPALASTVAPAPIAPATASKAAPQPPVAPITPASEATVAPIAPPSTNVAGGFSLSRQLGLGIARIVIDPGHGGRDPGAKVKGLTESSLVLDVALRLEKLLKKQKNVEVVLTRRTNAFVALEERTAIANKSGADLFLSIHANASGTASVQGIETYFLNFAPNPEAEALAARENAGSSRSMRHLPDIVEAIALNNKIDESRDFATMVQSTLYERLRKANKNLKNLGVKQAPFMVLIGATMPSILAEISFLTNEQEGKLLKTDKYRQQIADALLAGIMRYQGSLKKTPAVASAR